jgi:hypothetical protein
VQGWNESICYYDTLVNSTTALTPGRGFWVYLGNGFSTTTSLSWAFTGAAVTGPVAVPVSSGGGGGCPDEGFNLIANPYASPVSWSNLYAIGSNFDFANAIYVWNPDAGGGNGAYGSWVPPISTNGVNNVIPAGQGFYVDNSLFSPGFGLPTLFDFNESAKVDNNTSANPLLRSASGGAAGNSDNYFKLKVVSGNTVWDETAIRIHGSATNGFDSRYDARKIFVSPGYAGYPGSYNYYTTISSKDADGFDYSIQSIPPSNSKSNIPVLVKVISNGTYEIKATDFENYQSCIILKDKYDNSFHDLKAGSYFCYLTDTMTVPRFEMVVCENGSAPASLAQMNAEQWMTISKDKNGPFVKTHFDAHTKAKISALNIIGQQLMNEVEVEGTETETRLNINVRNQVVIIRVQSDKGTVVKKIVMD